MFRRILVCLTIACAGVHISASAHQQSDAYVWLDFTEAAPSLRWDVALRDLEHVIGLDTDFDGSITWGEVRARSDRVLRYAEQRISVSRGTVACPLRAGRLQEIETRAGDAFAVVRYQIDCQVDGGTIDAAYAALFDEDPTHRAFLHFTSPSSTVSRVLAPESQAISLTLEERNAFSVLSDYWQLGVEHIASGFDHLLFLLSLLLCAVLVRDRRRGGLWNRWEPSTALRPVLWDITKVVTAFSLAHSITLAAASLGWLTIRSEIVEAAIAATVVVVAVNNLIPILPARRATVAFVLGLIHGLGFANVLSEIIANKDDFLLALLGFNFGVESGQLIFVLCFVPCVYLIRARVIYRQFIVSGASIAIAVLALAWFVDRAGSGLSELVGPSA
ncbi:MAG: HupE/UreJ family protein [Gammaproteobacteria bacterium]|nr:HupE/UreJ family protein [Gammaproteobacteria bacterium]